MTDTAAAGRVTLSLSSIEGSPVAKSVPNAVLVELDAELARLEAAHAALLDFRNRFAGNGTFRARITGALEGAAALSTPEFDDLGDEHVRPARRRRPRRREPVKRAGGVPGSRAAQVLEMLGADGVEQAGGLTIPELAEGMGCTPNYLYRALPRMLAQGKVAALVRDSEDDPDPRLIEPGTELEDRSALGHNPRWVKAE